MDIRQFIKIPEHCSEKVKKILTETGFRAMYGGEILRWENAAGKHN